MDTFLQRLLNLYNLSQEDYLKMTRAVTKDDLEDYHNFKNIEIAKERIFDAIRNKEKIMIYGDYDCDGITSTSILVNTFSMLDYNVGYYIPSRYMDGYGINVEMVEMIHSKGYKLIITVDNGVAQFDALKRAKELNIDVILTDHHELKEEIPDCFTIVHPSLKEDGTNLAECGAYVAFNLSRALLGYVDDYSLTLASLATISDMMPLVSYNRDIVRIGLEIAKKSHFIQLDVLVGNNGIEDEKSFSFDVAPKVNSLGRVLENRQVNKGVEFFTSLDKTTILDDARLIEFTNEKRKFISSEATKKIDYKKYEDKVFIIDRFDDIQEGLIGLVANRVLNEANKPCVIFTKDKKTGDLKGSARSLEGLPLVEVFSKLDDLIIQFGGHAMAGGISIKEENLEAFIDAVNNIAKDYTLIPKKKLILECEKEELNFENFALINSLAPYGEGFNEPYLMIEVQNNAIGYLSSGKHIKGSVNQVCSFVGFNFNKDFGKVGSSKLIGKLKKDDFRKGNFLSFVVEEVIKA